MRTISPPVTGPVQFKFVTPSTQVTLMAHFPNLALTWTNQPGRLTVLEASFPIPEPGAMMPLDLFTRPLRVKAEVKAPNMGNDFYGKVTKADRSQTHGAWWGNFEIEETAPFIVSPDSDNGNLIEEDLEEAKRFETIYIQQIEVPDLGL